MRSDEVWKRETSDDTGLVWDWALPLTCRVRLLQRSAVTEP